MGIQQEGFCDIHTHIVPGVDDGPGTIEDAVSMLREAAEAGVGRILCTPHLSTESPATLLDAIYTKFELLRNAVRGQAGAIELGIGAELMLHPDLPAAVNRDSRLTVNGRGKFALIEMPAHEMPLYTRSVFFDLQMKGVTPIWAHPERCREIQKDHKILDSFLNSGVLVQVNAGSLIGLYGWTVRRTARKIVKDGYAHICASDAHRIGHIRGRLPKAFTWTKKKTGEMKALELFVKTPSRVMGDQQ